MSAQQAKVATAASFLSTAAVKAIKEAISTTSSGSSSPGSTRSGSPSSGPGISGASRSRSTSAPTGKSSGSSPGSGSGSSGGGQSGGSTSVAAATADVANAKIALATAEVNLGHATLTAPISGTVASMPFTKGNAMTTNDAVTIVGSGSVQLTTDVSETAIAEVKVGQRASVSVSTGSASAGTVTDIGILPATSTTSSTASYPVTVTVPKPAAALASGVTASVSITVASAKNAIVLPVSAVTKLTDTTGTVRTLSADNKATVTQVALGATGASTVQIISGVTAGQRVVLADNTEALPASNTTANRRAGAAGGAGFGGAGGAGGAGFARAGGGVGGAPPGGR